VPDPLFDRRTISRDSPASAEACPGKISWDYDRAELIADALVHVAGVILGLLGAIAIMIVAVKVGRIEVMSVVVYAVCLITMLVLSAAYNMWPISPTKWFLRRLDHSAIYLMIAGTYTPFLAVMKSGTAALGLGIGVWSSAVIGMVLKLALPGRLDRFAVVLFLLLGWSGVVAYESLAPAVPQACLWLLAIGGVLYSTGLLFHAWYRLRFHNAIWHGFVVVAASCHYSAVLTCLA
jgi:hemolysin III